MLEGWEVANDTGSLAVARSDYSNAITITTIKSPLLLSVNGPSAGMFTGIDQGDGHNEGAASSDVHAKSP